MEAPLEEPNRDNRETDMVEGEVRIMMRKVVLGTCSHLGKESSPRSIDLIKSGVMMVSKEKVKKYKKMKKRK